MAARDFRDLRPAVRQALADLTFPRTRQQIIAFVGTNPELLDARRVLTHLPERTYDNLDQVLQEVHAFQERIRQQQAQQ